jgi:hypothetical protein
VKMPVEIVFSRVPGTARNTSSVAAKTASGSAFSAPKLKNGRLSTPAEPSLRSIGKASRFAPMMFGPSRVRTLVARREVAEQDAAHGAHVLDRQPAPEGVGAGYAVAGHGALDKLKRPEGAQPAAFGGPAAREIVRDRTLQDKNRAQVAVAEATADRIDPATRGTVPGRGVAVHRARDQVQAVADGKPAAPGEKALGPVARDTGFEKGRAVCLDARPKAILKQATTVRVPPEGCVSGNETVGDPERGAVDHRNPTPGGAVAKGRARQDLDVLQREVGSRADRPTRLAFGRRHTADERQVADRRFGPGGNVEDPVIVVEHASHPRGLEIGRELKPGKRAVRRKRVSIHHDVVTLGVRDDDQALVREWVGPDHDGVGDLDRSIGQAQNGRGVVRPDVDVEAHLVEPRILVGPFDRAPQAVEGTVLC